jgi:sorting nexin-1/2
MEESSFDDLITPSTSSQPRTQEAFSWATEEEPNPFADLQSSSVYASKPPPSAGYDVAQISPFQSRGEDSETNNFQTSQDYRRSDSGDISTREQAQASEGITVPLSPASPLDTRLSEEPRRIVSTLDLSEGGLAIPSSSSYTPSSPPTVSPTPSTQPIEGPSTPAYDRVLVSPFRASDVEADLVPRLGTPASTSGESGMASSYFPQGRSNSDADSVRGIRADDASIKTVGLESDQTSVLSSKTSVQVPIADVRPEALRQAAGGRPTFIVTVGDPQKIGSEITASAHTVYTVRTRVSLRHTLTLSTGY